MAVSRTARPVRFDGVVAPESGVLQASRKGSLYIVLVDDDIALRYRHRVLKINARGYPVFSGAVRGRNTLQAVIMEPPKGMEVDHVNGDKLDNRRKNLQVVTHAENCRKRPRFKTNRTGYRGVCERPSGKFRASIVVDYKRVPLGLFDTAEEAARAYDDAARKRHKRFACVNFPAENETAVVMVAP